MSQKINLWWNKSRRAQSNTDFETWVERGVVPGGNNVPMVAYSIDSEGSNSMKSKNPNSGSNEVTIANTITTITPDPSDYRGGNAIVNNNSKQVRRLTPKECERLQGFPDGWTVSQSDSARYKQMGNAVAVPVVDWLIKGFIN